MGVRRFSTLPYAHKPGVAAYLNDWSRTFAADVPEVLWSGTFFPEDGVAAYVAELVDAGVELFKLHLQVGGVPPRRPAARRGVGAARGRRTCRSWCTPARCRSATTSPGRGRCSGCSSGTRGCRSSSRTWARRRWCGSCALAEQYERVRLDTTMVLHRLLRRCPTPTGWCRGWSTCSRRSCSAPTSRRSPTPTRTSSRAWPGSTSATTGCARSAGRTARSCSGSLDDRLPGEPAPVALVHRLQLEPSGRTV